MIALDAGNPGGPAAPRGLGRRVYDAVTLGVAQVIGLTNPARAMAYVQGRQALLSYAAGSRRGPNRRWNPKNTAADDLIRKDWSLVTARARDLARNSGNVAGALRKIANNVVFLGIRPQAQLRDASGKLDSKRNRAVEDIWKRWAEHPRVGFYDIERLVTRHSWVDGESLLHLYDSPNLYREGVVPLGVELLEADHLDSSVNGLLPNGNRAVRGIEFDAEGFPVAYWLFTEHPGASMSSTRTFSLGKSVRIDASRIIHPFEADRASQTRGISWLAAVIMEMHDFDEYQTSERIAARLTSAFGFFLIGAPPEFGPGMLGGLPGGTVSSVPALESAQVPDFIEPGRIQALPQGTKIQAEQFQRPGNNYDPYTRRQLKGASAGAGMSYEAFSNDFSDASYSSARQAALEERRGYQVQQQYLVNKLCSPLWRVWCQYLTLSGLADASAVGVEIPVTWQTPGWSWVDPQKDSNASKTKLEIGVTSRRRIAAEMGEDLDEVMAELREERETYGDLLPAPAAPAAKPKEPANAPQEG